MKKIRVLFLMSAGHLVGHWYIGLLMLVLPLLKQEFHLSFTEVGLLISARSLAGALGNSVSGVLADLFGSRNRILLGSSAGAALCWLLVGFSEQYVFILVLIPLFTMFNNLWHAPAMSLLSEAYPERRGFALGLHGSAANLGQALAPLVVGVLITYLGWRTAVKLNVLPGLTMGVLLLVMLPGLGALTKKKKKTTGQFWELFKEHLLKSPQILAISMVSVFRTMGQRGVEAFLGIFLADHLGLSPVWVGFYLSLLTFASAFPEPLIGWLSDRVGRKSILWVSLTISGLATVAITLVGPGAPLGISLALLGIFHYSLRPIIFAFALDLTPPDMGAATISYVFTWNQGFSALAPLVGGVLADLYGIKVALYFVAGLSLVAALCVGLLRPRVRGEVAPSTGE
ncbi:MAG TPA: MFS transporter [Deferrisomatales bacterium]|nr:MFS transporter [Deferrisomatales bacterium]